MITMIITTVILIDLIIPPFIIIISGVIIQPGERDVICFASTGCSLIKKPRTAAAPLTCVYGMLRTRACVRVAEKGKKGLAGWVRIGEGAAVPLPLLSFARLFQRFY